MNFLEIKKLIKIRECTHKATYISAANYFRQPLLKANNCQSNALLPNGPLCEFLAFLLIKY